MDDYEERPWGNFYTVSWDSDYKIKVINVEQREMISLQSHCHRDEHWVIVKGVAKVTIDDQEVFIGANKHIHIPALSKHRVENVGKTILTLVEVQLGDYLEEDDIIRYKDKYGRIDNE